MKTDQERQNLGRELAQNLSKLENKLIVPIEKDVVSKVEQVRKDKGLDCIVVRVPSSPVLKTLRMKQKL